MPTIDPSAFVAPGAVVVGDVLLGPDASVWYGAVLRGDMDRIVVGTATNIQDGTIVHVDEGVPCSIGARVGVGHRAILHGCTVEDDCLVGMGAVLLNGVRLGPGSVIGAGAVVPEGMVVPPGMVALGVPARVRGPASETLRARQRATVAHYLQLSARHRRSEGL